MSRLGKNIKKFGNTKLGKGFNKFANLTPAVKLAKGIGGKLQRRKTDGKSSDPQRNEMQSIQDETGIMPLSKSVNDIPHGETLESSQANVRIPESGSDNGKKIVMDETDPTQKDTIKDKDTKLTPMEWLKKNWYIPVAIIVVVGGAWYFLKAKK
jgi:hypothetical protein